jgi:hypothetical protein
MTTSVTIKARAWGATVALEGADRTSEEHTLEGFQEKIFHIEPGETVTFTVTHGEEPAEEERVSGSAQNDELIKEVDPATLSKLSGADNLEDGLLVNESGPGETGITTESRRPAGKERKSSMLD